MGDEYFDQIERSGHAARVGDLDLFAGLGIRALRYPILWERTAPDEPGRYHWDWADERLGRLRELGVRPIVGLVHHGSGPRYTSLLDPSFAEQLARFARAVAERYPWVDAYTPINEPLTTARFSGLYGFWYPHGRDPLSFVRTLLTQCRATVLAMRAIRTVNPGAQLIATDDLGRTYSTRRLGYQAEFENERRWIGWDLLCGRVGPCHPMWDELLRGGASVDELEFFRTTPCPPDVIGINYYVTSDRFLDHRVRRYPEHVHGGNAFEPYADVEAVRVSTRGIAGPCVLLREAWERYGLPLAITEVHLGCSRAEQLRWFRDAWESGCALRAEGVDVQAVTAWSLLGCFDWSSLLTRSEGHYEPGVFDLRGPAPRPTALARLLSEVASGGELDHPVLDTPGWWRREQRFAYRPARPAQPIPPVSRPARPARAVHARPLLITGATGTLGSAFARVCAKLGLAHHLLARHQLDIADDQSVERALDEVAPWAVVNAAGYVRVDDAEREPDLCYRENATGPAMLADTCARRGVRLLTYSSDLVFDGTKSAPYLESDATHPLGAYGRSKADAELRVLERLPSALVIRTSAFFGPWDPYNFVTLALQALARNEPWAAADDAVVSPTYVPDLVQASLELLIDGESGIWHLASPGGLSWAELARTAARMAGLDASLIEARPTASFGFAARRPVYSVLGSERGTLLPPLDDALSRYVTARAARLRVLAAAAPATAGIGAGS